MMASNSNAKAAPDLVNEQSPNAAGTPTPQQLLLNKLPKGILETAEEEEALETVKRNFTQGSIISFLLYVTLSLGVLYYSPASSFVKPNDKEFRCYVTVGILVVVTNVSRFFRLLQKEERAATAVRHGILLGILLLQCITVTSSFGIAFFPSPVLYDHITGLEYRLFHWVEWIGLTFFMTFLIDNIDQQHGGAKYARAVSLCLSTAVSLVFPHCPDRATWMVFMILSIILFCPLYVLLYTRFVTYVRVRITTKRLETISAADEEAYEMVRSSFLLTLTCACCWTILVATFLVICLAPEFVPLRPEEMKIITTLHYCTMEVISKIWYLTVLIDAYERVFDSNKRMARRMEELRRFMSVVWEFSSDVIVFSYQRGDDHYSARISPAFLNVVGGQLPSDFLDGSSRGDGQDISLLLEITPSEGHFYVFAMDLSKPVDRYDVSRFKKCLKGERISLRNNAADSAKLLSHAHRNLAVIAELIVTTFKNKQSLHQQSTTVGQQQQQQQPQKDIVCVQQFHMVDDDGQEKEKRCEAKISLLKDGQAVIAMRDISDRLEKFEAEKRLVEECAIKKKDAEANQFTRHEVKNGILAAIGLLDHVREGIARDKSSLEEWKALSRLQEVQVVGGTSCLPTRKRVKLEKRKSSDGTYSPEQSITASPSDYDTEATVAELDSTLHDILDTILDEVMAREIIYEKYIPRKERLVVTEVLSTLRTGSSHRFPLTVHPDPFPKLALDRQLLRHIYRNAVSNACKYGKLDGVVRTTLSCDDKKKNFTMEISNEPGDGHEQLVKLTDEESATVFRKESRLNIVQANDCLPILGYKRNSSESSGNGAWIMQKCAETLGGSCSISFTPEGTVLTFTCPVELGCGGGIEGPGPSDGGVFALPPNTWGIVVDDSAIQRKLMDRSYKNSGIEDSRRVVLGKDVHEVTTFPETIAALLKEHPEDIFILIVDENLDIDVDGGARHETISGSESVKRLLGSIDDSSETRLLALIRSANDSPENIRTYLDRAHGFLHKEPLKRGQVLDAVEPWWRKRFSPELTAKASPTTSDADDISVGPLPDDIRAVIESVNSLCSYQDRVVLGRRWQVIREKLHGLKGDLKMLSKNADLLLVVDEIDSLKGFRQLPNDFVERWSAVQRKIEDLL